MWAFYAAVSTGLVLSAVKVQGKTCGVVGTNTPEQQANRDQGFYLNTQEPAPCSGTVNEFRYCYYRTDLGFAVSYDFTFAVYRETSPGSGSYSNVSEAFTTGRNLSNANLGLTGTFACATFPVDSVQVQAGDVLGACIYDPPDNAEPFDDILPQTNRVQLDVVGNNASTSRFLMTTDNSGCGDFSVPDPVSSLSMTNSLVLHIFADITHLPTTHDPWPPPTLPTTGSSTTPPSLARTPNTTTESDGPQPSNSVSTVSTTSSSDQIPDSLIAIIAAVVSIILLTVLAAIVVTFVIAVLCARRQRVTKKSCNISESNGFANPIRSESSESVQMAHRPIGHAHEGVPAERLNTRHHLRKINNAVWDVRSKWRSLGRELGVDLHTLNAIAVERRDMPDECLPHMLQHWLDSEVKEPTWEVLIGALEAIGFVQLARRLREHVCN